MSYHPNNILPKEIRNHLKNIISDGSDYDLLLIFEGDKYYAIKDEFHSIIYKKLGEGVNPHRDDDTRIRIHDAREEIVIKIAKLLDEN